MRKEERKRKREDRERGKRERGVCVYGSGGGKGMTRESIEKVVLPPAPSIGISQSGMHIVNETSISMSECVSQKSKKQRQKCTKQS